MLVAGLYEPHVYFDEKLVKRWHAREQRGRRSGPGVVLDELPVSLSPVSPVYPPDAEVRGRLVWSVEYVAERWQRWGWLRGERRS
jgi:hypothetical protein